MQITRATDYAVRVMIHLAGLPAGSNVRQSDLAAATGVSGHFLSKVLQHLVRTGLIRSQRGLGGGYVLAQPGEKISLLTIVAAMEGSVRLNQCLEEGPSCERKGCCPAHDVWIEAQLALEKVLGGVTVAELAQRVVAGGPPYARHAAPFGVCSTKQEKVEPQSQGE
jgi:Rrf2 family protein